MQTVSFTGFLNGIDPAAGDNTKPAFDRAMAYCRAHPYTTLVIPAGIYRISTPLALETMEKVMRGDYGANPQPILFNPRFRYDRGIVLEGQTGTVILAEGVTLLVDGYMEPVSVIGCSGVTVRGLTIDHKRKPYSKGRINAVRPLPDGRFEADVVLSADTPVSERTPLRLRHAFRSEADGRYFAMEHTVEYIDPLHLRLVIPREDSPLTGESVEGMTYCTVHCFHSRPAILIEEAVDTRLEHVTIHAHHGMGVVGNRSHDITLSGLAVVPSAGEPFSTNTDATHFTSLTGLLRMENCVFDSQGDDFLNVHNYYHTIERVSARECRMICTALDGTHSQMLDYPDIGDTLELADRRTLAVRKRYTVLDCVPDFDPDVYNAYVRLDADLPEDPENCFLCDVTRLPRVEVTGCRARNHYARSVLLKTRGALVEGNTFSDVFGPAVYIASESYWGEGVCPADITVRNNRIMNSRKVRGEAGGIVVKADCDEPTALTLRNITIEDNVIDVPACDHAIYCRNVKGLKICGNTLHCGKAGNEIAVETCADVHIS